MATTTETQWTDMAEGIAFISAILGEPFTTATKEGVFWSALGVKRGDGVCPYPVSLQSLGSEITVTLSFSDVGADHAAHVKLYAIMGWAAYHGHNCEHD